MFQDNDQLEHVIDQHVAQRLKYRRIVLGLTRQELGEAVNVSVQQIHKYETATNRISSSKLFHLSTFLKVPINYFFEMLESSGIASSSTLAEESLAYDEENNVTEREVLKLMQVYKKIKPQAIRRKIIELIDAVGEGEAELKDKTKE